MIIKNKKDSEKSFVFVRAVGDADWTLTGTVACLKPTSVAAAITTQKKLILDHAPRIFKQLGLKSSTLEVGYASDRADEPTLLEKGVKPAELANCGFVGEPDAGGFYK